MVNFHWTKRGRYMRARLLTEFSLFQQIVTWAREEPRFRKSFWTGLSDQTREGHFVWTSGRSLTADVAEHWGEGEPNNDDKAWLPDGYSQIFYIVCVWPFGLLDYGSATLRCKI